MCGFAGLLAPAGDPAEIASAAERMAATLVHRGPDDSGSWADPGGQAGLGFRRLSIIDLSPEGHQPMTSADGRYTVAFNGEIYNFAALRQELEAAGVTFRGRSDTEVMLAAMSRWGLDATIPRLWGMFAIAIWDATERTLHLVRDRLGKKPLYYGWFGRHFLFGSELKALRAHPAFHADVDRSALASYLRFSYVPAPMSIYRGVWKVPAASHVVIDPAAPGALLEPYRYWDAIAVAHDGQRDMLRMDDEAATDALEELLSDAIRLRAVADVPIGAFLSGGIDSSVVVALLQAQTPRKVSTFTVGYEHARYDESAHAKAVAQHLGTDHTELHVTPEETLAVIPRLPTMYDEPFADASQIPTALVSQLARRHVTVALSGDGGDEVFGGYNRYVTGTSLWSRLRLVPAPVRRGLARVLDGIQPATWDRIGRFSDRVLPARKQGVIGGNTVHKLASVVGLVDVDAMYVRLVSTWPEPESILVGVAEPAIPWTDWHIDLPDPAHRMMLLDLLTYLPDDIMVKVDRASMGASLEARAPLLDHRLIELSWRLPLDLKIRDGEGKWLLRRVLERHVPRAMFDRPKHGFGIPIDAWIRGPLREWAGDLLSPERLRREGYFQVAPIEAAFQDHVAGRRNLHEQLWPVLMFEAWLAQESDEGRPCG